MSKSRRSLSPTQNVTDLDLLHALVGHYARQLWDVQETRISMGLRVGAMKREGLQDQWTKPLEAVAAEAKPLERSIDRELTRLMRQHPLREWIENAPGVALPGVARILGITGRLDKFETVSKLWAYLGLHVREGRAPRRKRGELANWSIKGRTVCYQLAESIVRVGKGPYREAYDRKKAEYGARERTGPSECPFGQLHLSKSKKPIACGLAHIHNAAMRYAIKCYLRDLWSEWRKVMCRSRAA